MKILFAIVCASSLLSSAEEMPNFTPTTLQQPHTPTQLELPPPVIIPPRKSPFIAVTLSSLLPGLGHVYLGDMQTAGQLIGTTGAGIGITAAGIYRDNEEIYTSSAITLSTIYSYGVYAAYRDTRKFNGGSYSYKMPTDSFVDLTFASFKPSILKKPEVWGGLLGALTLAITTAYFVYPEEAHIRAAASSERDTLYPPVAFSVGIGEEALFRGYVLSEISEQWNPTAGLIISSLLFGAAHIPNAQAMEPEDQQRYYAFGIPLITLFGAYCGWLTQKNHSLQESVALHSWYDFTLFAASAFAKQAACTGRPGFALAIPF